MYFPAGFLLGLAYAAAPGPVGVETLRRGLQGGLPASLAVQIGSSVGLAAYAGLALLGARWLLRAPAWRLPVGLAGAAVLMCLGLASLRDARTLAARPAAGRVAQHASWHTGRRALSAGAALSLASPLDLVFWLSLRTRLLHDPALDARAYLAGFALGCVLAALAIALLAGWAWARLTRRAALALARLCGPAFSGFGLQMGWSLSRELALA